MSKITFILFVLFLPLYAHGATCDAGYYLENGTCVNCTNGLYDTAPVYCPGDDMRYDCPDDGDTDYQGLLNEEGFYFYPYATHMFWQSANLHKSITTCTWYRDVYNEKASDIYLSMNYNQQLGYYWPIQTLYYLRANTGYYLSEPYLSKWWQDVKPCTNAPANAHYTGPGTPDSTDGSVVDANDCPWECDDGYYNDNGTCTICPAGYACSGGTMTNCADVTGTNGRKTYSSAGASLCTECPAVESSLSDRLLSYGYSNISHVFSGWCTAYFTDTDDSATFKTVCWYDVANGYGGTSNNCQVYKDDVSACSAGKYLTIESASEWNGLNFARCKGIDCMNGKICTDVGTGYYSPDGDTLRYACDTPPANAHIISACTSATNTVWECDSGTVHMSNDTCEPLCTAGMTKLRTSTGLSFNVYANKLTTPSLNLSQNNIVCYVNLLPGVASGAINVQYGNTVYHTAN